MAVTAQISSQSAHLCIGLGDASQLLKTAQVPGPRYDNFVKARRGAIVILVKAGAPYKAADSLGGLYGIGK